ncbi:hypothetical protein OG339_47245 (plasmid) [Streptosporangium sp. NBC_01495]|uniref:hypothetical protein n=1 Tax=Streptosporangium sp. NBC_01495 TaxID=2903899 RepID=UPI002E32EEBA|nr:hypothetical protein [Streptosporangium sp. NBC_01495]
MSDHARAIHELTEALRELLRTGSADSRPPGGDPPELTLVINDRGTGRQLRAMALHPSQLRVLRDLAQAETATRRCAAGQGPDRCAHCEGTGRASRQVHLMVDVTYADATEREDAERLAKARHQMATEDVHSTALSWQELTAEERSEAMSVAVRFLRAGRRAGLYAFPTTPPVTAAVTDPSGRPIPREDYENFLRQWMGRQENTDRLPLLDGGEAFVVAALLDELAGTYPGEPLGQLAREMAGRLNDRRGI